MTSDSRDLPLAGAPIARLFDWLEARSRFGMPAFSFFIGILLSRAFAPLNIFPLLFIAIPFMIFLIDRARSGWHAFVYGWWTAFGFLSLGLNWIGYSFTQQQAVPAALAPVAVLALAGVMSLYIAFAFWASWKLWRPGPLRVLIFASFWTLFEIARGLWFTGFPWHQVGSAWAEWAWVAQSAYHIGVYGISFLTLLVAGSFVCLFDSGALVRRVMGPAIGIVLLMLVALGGYLRLADSQTRYHLGISLRLVQANVQQYEKWLSYRIEDHFDKHLALSRGGDTEGKAKGIRLLIWPETAVQRENFDREGSLHRWRISKLLDYGAFAITGAPRYRKTDDGYAYYNSLFALNSSADLYARYDKVHLVPFGEFLPFEKTLRSLGLSQLTGGGSFTAGQRAQTIRLPGMPGFSPLICYEAVFPGQVTDPHDRPDWLLNITNDAWFGTTEGPYQHLALARLRAIEEGLPMVRAASTGVSAVIDGYGRTLSHMPVGRQGVLDSPLPMAIDRAPLSAGTRVILVALLCSFVIFARLIYCWQAEKAGKGRGRT